MDFSTDTLAIKTKITDLGIRMIEIHIIDMPYKIYKKFYKYNSWIN